MPTTTASMNLSIPNNGESSYPTSISDSLTAIDTHDHSSGKGVAVPTTSLSGTIATAQIADLGVTTGKLAALSVTRAKQAAVGEQTANISAFSTTNSALTDVTGATVTITSTGRPIMIAVSGGCACSRIGSVLPQASSVFALIRGATELLRFDIAVDIDPATGALGSNRIDGPLMLMMLDAQAAGTYTYKLQTGSLAGDTSTTSFVNASKIFAYEL